MPFNSDGSKQVIDNKTESLKVLTHKELQERRANLQKALSEVGAGEVIFEDKVEMATASNTCHWNFVLKEMVMLTLSFHIYSQSISFSGLAGERFY
jgi:hypothetical protein